MPIRYFFKQLLLPPRHFPVAPGTCLVVAAFAPACGGRAVCPGAGRFLADELAGNGGMGRSGAGA